MVVHSIYGNRDNGTTEGWLGSGVGETWGERGLSRSEAIRTALLATEKQILKEESVVAEIYEQGSDQADINKMHLITEIMATLRKENSEGPAEWKLLTTAWCCHPIVQSLNRINIEFCLLNSKENL